MSVYFTGAPKKKEQENNVLVVGWYKIQGFNEFDID